jgi:hypothetical protein
MDVGRRRFPLRKGAIGDALVVAIFAFVAASAFGLARWDYELAVFRAVELELLVFFHCTSSYQSANSPS